MNNFSVSLPWKLDNPYRSQVIDMHAEAICQAAFLRYLGSVSDMIADVSNTSNNSDFFNRIQAKTLTFHMYVSSAPCGNACIRKWGKNSFGSRWSEKNLGEKSIHEGTLLNMDDKEKLQEHCRNESAVSISDTVVIVEFLREGHKDFRPKFISSKEIRPEGNYCILYVYIVASCQKVPKSDFQSKFFASKICRIESFLFFFNINLGAIFLKGIF